MKKKKTGMTVAVTLIIVMVLLFLSTGGKIGSIMLLDYSVSEDGSTMKMKVGIASSMGYVRKLKSSDYGNKKHITFYSTYGLNSSIGAKDEYQISLSPSCNEIYFYNGESGYKLKLQKNSETGEWEKS